MKTLRYLMPMLVFCLMASSTLFAQRVVTNGIKATRSAAKTSRDIIRRLPNPHIGLTPDLHGLRGAGSKRHYIPWQAILDKDNDDRRKNQKKLKNNKGNVLISNPTRSHLCPPVTHKPSITPGPSNHNKVAGHEMWKNRQKLPILTIKDTVKDLSIQNEQAFSRYTIKDLAEKQYPEVKAMIERGECDSLPAKLIWAGNYALAKGDTLFSDICFEKAKSPYLSTSVMWRSIYGGMSRSRDRIPELLQYMAERNFYTLAGLQSTIPDHIRELTTSEMVNMSEAQCPELLPLIRLYHLESMTPQEINKEMYYAIMMHADSSLTYSDQTIELLIHAYMTQTRALATLCFDFSTDSLADNMCTCMNLCANPRLEPYIENDYYNSLTLADIAGILGLEEECVDYLIQAASIDSERYAKDIQSVFNDLEHCIIANLDSDEGSNRARFRLYTSFFDDWYANGLDLICSERDCIMNHAVREKNTFGSNHIIYCDMCHQKAITIVAFIDELRKMSNAPVVSPFINMWLDLYSNYMLFAVNPERKEAINAVEQVIKRANELKNMEKDCILLEATLALCDMKMQSGADAKDMMKLLQPLESKVEGKNFDKQDYGHHFFYKYMTLLSYVAADSKKSRRYGKTERDLEGYRIFIDQ